jgi:pimeloyl-ACP methyl ester carboxylesterase
MCAPSAGHVRRPFSRVRFSQLSAAPRRPHPYFDAGAADLTMDSAPFGRLRIHYRTFGAGPPLLLVHGLMTSGYSWRYVLEGLGECFTVIAPDLPGCGRSDVPVHGSFRAIALATWIGEFQEAVGITGCRTVGNSLGGYLCMRRALDAPRSFERLVNIHSPALPDARLRALHAGLAVPGVASRLAWYVSRSPQRWAYRNVHYYDETLKSREEAREYGNPLATRAGARAFVRYLRETLAPADLARFVAELERRRGEGAPFPVPLLLLYAREDRMVPPAVGEALQKLVPTARLVWLERSSHFAQVDTPDEVVRTLLDFFAQPAVSDSPGPGG